METITAERYSELRGSADIGTLSEYGTAHYESGSIVLMLGAVAALSTFFAVGMAFGDAPLWAHILIMLFAGLTALGAWFGFWAALCDWTWQNLL